MEKGAGQAQTHSGGAQQGTHMGSKRDKRTTMGTKCGIKAAGRVENVRALSVVRKITGLPLTEAKRRLESGAPIVEYAQSDASGWLVIVRLSIALDTIGVSTQTYAEGRPRPVSYFVDRLRTERPELFRPATADPLDDDDWWDLDLGFFDG